MQIASPTVQEWGAFVESLPDYSFFQLPIWAQAYEETYPNCRIATKVFVFDDGIQVLVPLVEKASRFGFKFYESLPRGGYGGLLWNKKPSEEQITQILRYLLNRRVLDLAIYPDPRKWEEFRFLEGHGFECKEAFTHIVELGTDFDWVWKNRLDDKNRNQVRKALKSGVTITIANNVAQVKDYYDLYLQSAYRWGIQEVSMRPLQFFESLFQLGGDKVKYYLARYDTKCISGAIIFYESKSCFHWGGAMLKEYGRYCPNHLLLSNVIEHACNSGCQFLNMGGSAGLPGVQRFKESFGAEKSDYKYFVYQSSLLRLYRNVSCLLRLSTPKAQYTGKQKEQVARRTSSVSNILLGRMVYLA